MDQVSGDAANVCTCGNTWRPSTLLLRFSVTVVTAAICCRLYGLADVQHAFDESKKIIMLFLVVFVLILYLR